MSVEYIYILELNAGKYYIGRTRDLGRRFMDHKDGRGSAWTRQHGGCKLIELRELKNPFDEDMITLEYMNTYGMDNVRGGSYVTNVLTDQQQTQITRACRSANDLCQGCGKAGHYEAQCYVKNTTGKRSTKSKISAEPTSTDGVADEYVPKTKSVRCSKCNRFGHEYFNCYAKTVV
jgi:predicted GIY-YIG superfamily endonuclease